ncbi:SubName: Full=Uncharacterized protein {ECO:0000313/EMBL:CCA76384.1} [Serendipita indica DSM 11827]|nr:SubName: Full=Uncharacterized protein {ECO:0000313/EMBL:CCA76384.1} [Serendipita indica DSM 11827]
MAFQVISDISQRSYRTKSRKGGLWKKPLLFMGHRAAASGQKAAFIRGEGSSADGRDNTVTSILRPGKMQSKLDLLASPIGLDRDYTSDMTMTSRDRCETLSRANATPLDHIDLQSNNYPTIPVQLRPIGPLAGTARSRQPTR